MVDQRQAFSGFLLDVAAELTQPIEGMHRAIAARVFRNVGPASLPVRLVHDGIASAAYGSVRSSLRLAARGARVLPVDASRSALDGEPPSDRALAAQAAINGFLGDRLAQEGDSLAWDMTLVHDRQPLAADRTALAAALPDASSRVAVFVHGLAGSERVWWSPPGHKASAGPSYGDRLADELGVTPLYVRYNSGLHISDNGAHLSDLLDRVVANWPASEPELILVGHSMGGLVARSACVQASRQEPPPAWVGRVRHVVSLGSPYQGASLERVVNRATRLMGRVGEAKAVADVLDLRSDGVRDLRFGYILEDEWRDADPAAIRRTPLDRAPNLEGASHRFVSGSLRPGRRHPANRVLGDLLVTRASATGPARRPGGHGVEGTDVAHFAGVDHLALCNDPAVYARLRTWAGARLAASTRHGGLCIRQAGPGR